MKKSLAIILTLAMLLSVAMVGCGDNASTNSAGNKTPATSEGDKAPAASGQTSVVNPEDYTLIDVAHFDNEWTVDVDALGTFELSLSTHDPSTSMKCIFLKEWAQLVKEATCGGVNITVYDGGTIASPAEALAATEMGTCDMAWIIASTYADVLPVEGMFYLPGLNLENIPRDTMIMWDLYEKYPAFEADFTKSNLKLIHMYTTGTTGVFGPEVRCLDDLKGLNIRTLGGYASDIITKLGASPISMGPGDMYDSLSKGVIDGYTIEWSGVNTYRLYEVSDYYNMDNIYTSPMALIMNLDSYDQLPDEYKEILDYYSGREMSLQMAYLWHEDNLNCQETYSEESQIIHYEDYDKIIEIMQEYSLGKAAEISTDEFDAVAFYNDILDLVEKYDSEGWTYYRYNN